MGGADGGGGPAPLDDADDSGSDTPEGAPSDTSYGGEARRHIRGSALLLAGRAISLALNFASQILAVRFLAKSDYGSYSYAVSIVGVASVINIFGFPRVTGRFAVIYQEREEYGRLAGSLLLSLGVIVGLGVSLIAVVWGLRDSLAGILHTDELTVRVLLVLVALAPIHAYDTLSSQLLAAFVGTRSVFFRQHVMNPGLRFGAVLAAVSFGADAQQLALCALLAGIVGVSIYTTLIVRAFGAKGFLARFRESRLQVPAREVLSFGLPLVSSDILYIARTTLLAILIDYHFTSGDVAEYRASLPLARFNTIVVDNFSYLFVPIAARFFARGDFQGVAAIQMRSTMWVTVLTVPVFLTTFSLAQPVTEFLYGSEYARTAVIVGILAFGEYLWAVFGFEAEALQVLGYVRRIVICDVLTLAAVIALALTLIPRYGPIGAAWAEVISLVLYRMANAVALWSATGISPFRPRLLLFLALIFGGSGGLLFLQHTFALPLWLGLGVAALLSLLMVRIARRDLEIDQVFPEVLRYRAVRWLVGNSR